MIKGNGNSVITLSPNSSGAHFCRVEPSEKNKKIATTELNETTTKGWSPERRAAQSARIRAQKPWLKSTGPRSAAGKRRAKMNGLKHGHRSAEWSELSRLLRAQQLFVARWRAGRYHPPKRRLQWRHSRLSNTGAVSFTTLKHAFSPRPPSCGTGPPDA